MLIKHTVTLSQYIDYQNINKQHAKHYHKLLQLVSKIHQSALIGLKNCFALVNIRVLSRSSFQANPFTTILI